MSLCPGPLFNSHVQWNDKNVKTPFYLFFFFLINSCVRWIPLNFPSVLTRLKDVYDVSVREENDSGRADEVGCLL